MLTNEDRVRLVLANVEDEIKEATSGEYDRIRFHLLNRALGKIEALLYFVEESTEQDKKRVELLNKILELM